MTTCTGICVGFCISAQKFSRRSSPVSVSEKNCKNFTFLVHVTLYSSLSRTVRKHYANFSDLTWGRLWVTAVEPQFVLILIVPLLKVVQTLVIVLHLQTTNTVQENTECLIQADTGITPNIPVQMPWHFLLEWTCLDTHFAGTIWKAYSSVCSSNCDVQSGPQCLAPDKETQVLNVNRKNTYKMLFE